MGFVSPFTQAQPGLGEHIAESRIFPLAWVGETVEIKMRDVEPLASRVCHLVGLHDGVGGALDAAPHPERPQQVAHEGGFAGAQRAMEFEAGVADVGLSRQGLGEVGTRGFVGPVQAAGF